MSRFSASVIVLGLLSITVAATYVCTARAGATDSSPVVIDATGRTASGSFGTARNETSDPNQYIYCTINGTATQLTGACHALNAANPSGVSCTTANATLIAILEEATTDSFVSFVWNPSKVCTSIQVTESSKTEPKLL